jgi:hypothetical protein
MYLWLGVGVHSASRATVTSTHEQVVEFWVADETASITLCVFNQVAASEINLSFHGVGPDGMQQLMHTPWRAGGSLSE